MAVTIPITTEMVDTSLAELLLDGEFVMVTLDNKFRSPIVCFIVSFARSVLPVGESVSYIPDTIDGAA